MTPHGKSRAEKVSNLVNIHVFYLIVFQFQYFFLQNLQDALSASKDFASKVGALQSAVEQFALQVKRNSIGSIQIEFLPLPFGRGRIASGGHGLPKVSPGPAMPYPSMPCGRATP
jgi:hypothetical protein